MLPAESKEKYIQILHNIIAIYFNTSVPMKTKLFILTTFNQRWKNLLRSLLSSGLVRLMHFVSQAYKMKVSLTFLVRRSFSVGVFFLLFTFYLFPQSPQGFNYQAVARDGDNAILASTDLDVKIGLLQGSETGSLIW